MSYPYNRSGRMARSGYPRYPRDVAIPWSRYYHAVAPVASAVYGQAKRWYNRPAKKQRAKQQTVNLQIRGYRRSKRQSFPTKVKSQIRELKRLADSDTGTHIHRRRDTSSITTTLNGVNHGGWNLNTVVFVEDVLAQLRYYDIKIPGTLLQVDGGTGTFQKEFFYPKIHSKFLIRNNYQVPCKGRFYFVRSKADTNITALTAFTSGLTDVGNPTVTDPLVYLTDSILFNDLYRIVDSYPFFLQAGSEKTYTHTDTKGFQFDPSLVDAHALTYQRRYCDLQVIIRLEGVLGHDTVEVAEQTTMVGKLDILYDVVWEVKYAAGADIKTVTIDNNATSSITTAAVCANKPVADLQIYSIS